MQLICAPSPARAKGPTLFLAGTIDQGNSVDWQKAVVRTLEDLPVTLYNPRRDAWDASWDLKKGGLHPQLKRQINWELEHLDGADAIVMWLEGESFSPISLLELGLHAHEGKVIVGCPMDYSRAANIYVTCRRYGIPVCKTWASFLRATKKKTKELLGNR